MVRKQVEEASGRGSLTAHAAVERAIALADAEGIEAVSIRRLARELGVTPMALYWHFRDKDDLLDGMAARLFEDIDLAVDASAIWRDQLRAMLGTIVRVLRAHPAVATLVSTRTVASEAGLMATESLLDILRRGGFSPAEATQIARHALSTAANLVSGQPGVVARNEPGEVTIARQRALDVLKALPPERYPRLVEAAAPLSEGVAPDTYFAFGLDLLLAGIEAMSPGEASADRAP
jgi:AcrR family transcriptional regulator